MGWNFAISKLVSIGIICLLLIMGSFSSICMSQNNDYSEKSIQSDPEPPVTITNISRQHRTTAYDYGGDI